MTRKQVLSDPRVLAGTHSPVKNARCLGGWTVSDIEKRRASNEKHQKTDKYKATYTKYNNSENGRAAQARHAGTTKRILSSNRGQNARQDAKDAALIAEIDKQLTHILGGI